MKASSGFKLNKEIKRVLATFTDRHERGEYIRAMISAQLAYEKAKREAFKMKRVDSGDE